MRPLNDHGSILVSALVLIAIMSLLGLAVLNTGSQEMKIAANELRSVQALNLAEAGLQYAIRNLEADRKWRASGVTTPLGNGFYRVTVPDPINNVFTITSEGFVSSTTSPTGYHKLEVKAGRGMGVGVGEAGGAMLYLTNIATTIKLKAVATGFWPQVRIEGNVYINGDADVKQNTELFVPPNADPTLFPGGKATLYASGNITAAGNVGNYNFNMQNNVPVVTQPSFDFEGLKKWATIIYDTSQTFSSLNVTQFPLDSIVYVTGDVTLTGPISTRVTIICTGTLRVNPELYYASSSAGPAYFLAKQGIVFNNTGKQGDRFHGLYYTPESLITLGNQGFEVFGSLMVGSLPDLPNWSVLRYDSRLEQYAPPIFSSESFGLVDYYDDNQ